jgi:hypothetical protein
MPTAGQSPPVPNSSRVFESLQAACPLDPEEASVFRLDSITLRIRRTAAEPNSLQVVFFDKGIQMGVSAQVGQATTIVGGNGIAPTRKVPTHTLPNLEGIASLTPDNSSAIGRRWRTLSAAAIEASNKAKKIDPKAIRSFIASSVLQRKSQPI